MSMTAEKGADALAAAQTTNTGGGQVDPTGRKVGAADIKDLYKQGCDDVADVIRNHWINWSFILGEQNIHWDASRNQPDTLPNQHPSRTVIVNNRLWPSMRTLTAKLLRRPLVFDVEPDQPDDAAVGGARLAQGVIGDTAGRLNWENLRRDNVWHTLTGGVGLLGLEWDPTGHQALGYTDQGDAYGAGDVCCYALSILEVATEPGCRDIEHARWWIRAAALPPKQVQTMYQLAKEPAADASMVLSPLQQKLLDASGRSGGPKAQLTRVLTYYQRPDGKTPGQVAVVVGEKVVSQGGWPFPFTDRLNVVCVRETPMLGRWVGATVVTATRPLQRALNRAEDSIDEHGRKAGNARVVAQRGSLDNDELDDDPASIVTYEMGMNPPGYMEPPRMPNWWENRPVTLKGDIDDMLGVHDVSRGDTTGGDPKSGVALGFLAEQDDTPLGAVASELAQGWGRFATLVLETYAAKVDDTRKATVRTTGQLPEVVKWRGADFADQTTVTVPLDQVSPQSQAARFQKGLLMWDKGMFGQAGDAQAALRFANYVDMPGTSALAVDLDPDVAKAQRENHDMETGIDMPAPAEFDNNATHITWHNRFRKSAAYEQLPPDRQQVVDMHIQGHETLDAEQLGKQVAMGQAHPVLPTVAQGTEPPLAGDTAAMPVGQPQPPAPPAGADQGAPVPLGATSQPPQPGGQGGIPA